MDNGQYVSEITKLQKNNLSIESRWREIRGSACARLEIIAALSIVNSAIILTMLITKKIKNIIYVA